MVYVISCGNSRYNIFRSLLCCFLSLHFFHSRCNSVVIMWLHCFLRWALSDSLWNFSDLRGLHIIGSSWNCFNSSSSDASCLSKSGWLAHMSVLSWFGTSCGFRFFPMYRRWKLREVWIWPLTLLGWNSHHVEIGWSWRNVGSVCNSCIVCCCSIDSAWSDSSCFKCEKWLIWLHVKMKEIYFKWL